MKEVQICFHCGSMDWSICSDDYVARYHVRKNGSITFTEELGSMEFYCSRCGSTALVGVEGTTSIIKRLVNLRPMQRILEVLEYIVDGTLKVADGGFGPDEAIEYIEYFVENYMKNRKCSKKTIEDFVSRAKEIIGKWKLLVG